MAQRAEEKSSASSQKKAEAIMMITFIGSLAMVKMNMATGGPNAMNVQPKNSHSVMMAGVEWG